VPKEPFAAVFAPSILSLAEGECIIFFNRLQFDNGIFTRGNRRSHLNIAFTARGSVREFAEPPSKEVMVDAENKQK
jgi:hypothetical protein